MSGVRIEGDIRKLYKRLSKLENNDMRRVNAVLAEAIRAKKGKALMFNIGGKDIFVKKVHIPSLKVSIPARPFLGISEEDIDEIRATLLELVGEDE